MKVNDIPPLRRTELIGQFIKQQPFIRNVIGFHTGLVYIIRPDREPQTEKQQYGKDYIRDVFPKFLAFKYYFEINFHYSLFF
jgi:hypothetical protein